MFSDMSIATLQPEGQITIPANILQMWSIKPHEQVEISIHNGIVTLMPVKCKAALPEKNIMRFAGAGRGCWGNTPEAVDMTLNEIRDSWTR
jgi:bifunctional DNA-binding transcriptional regulator/antitoxin component of YhaV-PrlF toxin-antitoxin module